MRDRHPIWPVLPGFRSTMPGGFRTALLTLLSILWALFPAAAAGQEAPPPDPIDIVDRGLPIPDGFWQDNVAQQRASLFGIRPAITIRSWETNPWGLRARLAIQFAGLDFRSPEGVDLEKVSLAAIVPGVEFVLPTGRRSLFRPFLDVGVGSSTGLDNPALIVAGGGQQEFVFPAGRFELSLEPKLEYTRAFVSGARDDDYGALSAYTDARHPLPFGIGDRPLELGVYFKGSYLFSPLDFRSLDGEGTAVDYELQVGALFSFKKPPKLWIFPVPMIGFGWAFGNDWNGIRIRVGGDRLLRLPPESVTPAGGSQLATSRFRGYPSRTRPSASARPTGPEK
jgi:hypothetical protein